MKAFLSQWQWGRVWRLCLLPTIGFLIVAWLTTAPFLIGILNLVLISLSTAVCVAFFPAALDAYRSDKPLRDVQIIALGIWLAWFAYVLRTAISLSWRYFPGFKWVIDSDINSYFLFIGCCAAMFHLAAPGSIEGRIPPRRWVKIGLVVALGVFLALCLIYAADIQRGFAAHGGRWFLPHKPPLQVPQPL